MKLFAQLILMWHIFSSLWTSAAATQGFRMGESDSSCKIELTPSFNVIYKSVSAAKCELIRKKS